MKGAREYKLWKQSKILTPLQAIKAQCYECNGFEEGNSDCEGSHCPLYSYMPYNKNRKKKEFSEEQRKIMRERFKKNVKNRETLGVKG